MTYTTHIPKTTYAQRHSSFLAARDEARRSLGNCGVLHDVWVRACEAKLGRNYLDVEALEQGTRQIVKISEVMRALRPLAEQPDPPRYEPVSAAQTALEARTYGGISAGRLVRVLHFFKRLRRARGPLAVFRRASRLSPSLVNGLDIYKRVKTAVADLLSAVDSPETAITARPTVKTPARAVCVKWDVSPQKIYGWKASIFAKGYDPRQTSVYWLERQATALKRAVHHDHYNDHAPRKSRRRATTENTAKKIEVRTFIPPAGAQHTEQIWPPIDLVRLIEERREKPYKNCHSGAAPAEPGRSRGLCNGLGEAQIFDPVDQIYVEKATAVASQSEVLFVKETQGHHETSPTSRRSAPSDPCVLTKRKAHLPRHAVEEEDGTRKYEPWSPDT